MMQWRANISVNSRPPIFEGIYICSSGDSTAKASEQAQAAFTNTLSSSFSQAFAANQAILNSIIPQLTNAINNPQGFSPKELSLLKTNASDAVAARTNQAQVAASNTTAARSGPDLGSGVNAQIAGSIASGGAQEQEREASNIDLASAEEQQQNYWRAIGGLTNAAAAENPTGYANSETGSANATADLSRAVLASQQAGWQNIGGVISGIAGLGSAAVGAYKDLGFAGASAGGGK